METSLLNRIDHVGIACHDLVSAVAFYESTFGLAVVNREMNERQGVTEVMMRDPDAAPGTSYVQLLEPLRPDTPVGRFLERRGEGVHHIAYGVSDISAALAVITGTGVRPVNPEPQPGAMGTSIVFLHPKDVGGVLTELVQAPPPA
jgi:methylmalonyl-CoA/ethylmalonyl-CoA epimerase